eukprot:scaffold9898_cov129-Isochrysis_galbana.AAC.1
MARTAIRHAIYSAAAAQYRFPVSPPPLSSCHRRIAGHLWYRTTHEDCVMTVIRPGYIFRTHLQRPLLLSWPRATIVAELTVH